MAPEPARRQRSAKTAPPNAAAAPSVKRDLSAWSGMFSRGAGTSRCKRGHSAASGNVSRRAGTSRGERRVPAESGHFPRRAETFRGERRLIARSGVFPRDAGSFRETRGLAAVREHLRRPARSRPAYERVKKEVENRSLRFREIFSPSAPFLCRLATHFLRPLGASASAGPDVLLRLFEGDIPNAARPPVRPQPPAVPANPPSPPAFALLPLHHLPKSPPPLTSHRKRGIIPNNGTLIGAAGPVND